MNPSIGPYLMYLIGRVFQRRNGVPGPITHADLVREWRRLKKEKLQ